MLKNKKMNKMLVGIIATGMVGASSTAYFYSESLKAEAQTEQVEDRATKLEATLSKKVDSETRKSTELKKTIDNKNKEVTSLKKKLEQSKSAEQEEIKAREIAAQQIQEQQLVESIPVEKTSAGYVVEHTPVQQSQSVSSAPSTDDNWHRQNRREVESTNNYKWDWGNGYQGAYQFTQQTWNATAAAHGLNPNDTSPANQDAMADAYANDRYGGWQNVPTVGGW